MSNESCCRICLGPPILPLFEINEGILLGQLLADFANVLIAENDGKSAYLCENCGAKLKLGVQFQKQIQEAENRIQININQSGSKKIKLENTDNDDEVYEYEFLEETTDETGNNNQDEHQAVSTSPSMSALKSEEILRNPDPSDDENSKDILLGDEMEGESTLVDEQQKFSFIMPPPERIAQRLSFEGFDYLEIDGERCCGCSFIAADRDELIQHSKNCHSQNYYADSGYTCPTCYQKFQTQEKLANHIEYYSYCDIFLCTICNESFVDKKHLKTHQETSHLPDPSNKQSADIKANPRSKAEGFSRRTLHVKLSDTRSHSCCFVRCWEGFDTDEELLEHVQQVHEGKRRENMLASSKNGTETKFTCLVCQRAFDTERQLLVHVSYKQKRDEYICQQCGKNFHKACLLRDHEQKDHSEQLPEYACDECGKAFWKLSVLKNHRKIHVPFEKVPCVEPGCEMIFRDTALMKRHCRNVHGDAPWHCRFCPKKLRTKEAMDIHERVHTGEKPFPCRQGCDRRFAHATDRVRHERAVHTSEKPHKCSQCNAAYVRRRELLIHQQRHHNSDEN